MAVVIVLAVLTVLTVVTLLTVVQEVKNMTVVLLVVFGNASFLFKALSVQKSISF